MSNERGGAGFIAGLIFGAVAGAAVGLLCSPKPGKENRELLAERFPELRERAPEIINRAKVEARNRLEAGMDAFHEASSETRFKLTHELDEAQEGRPS